MGAPAQPMVDAQGRAIRVRNVQCEIIVADDSPALKTAINAFCAAQTDASLLAIFHVADWEVLILYAD